MSIFRRIFQNIAVSYCLFTVALLVWGLDKGFDLSDEGYYLMCLKYPGEYLSANQWGNSVLGSLINWMNPGIISYRVIRLILTITSSFYLAQQLSKFIKQQLSGDGFLANRIVGFAIVFSGAVLSYSIYPITISYNSLSVILLQIIVGQVIYLVGNKGNSKAKFNLFLVGLGSTLVMLLVAKISTGALMMVVVLAGLNIRRILLNSPFVELFKDMLFVGLGCTAIVVILSIVDQSTFSRIGLLSEEMTLKTGAMLDNIYGYYTSFAKSLATVRNQIFWGPILLFLVGYFFRWKEKRMISIIQVTLTSIYFGYVLYKTFNEGYFDNIYKMLVPHLVLMISISGLVLGTIIGTKSWSRALTGKRKTANITFILALLLFIPLIGTIGTNNLFSVQAILFLFAWSTFVFSSITL